MSLAEFFGARGLLSGGGGAWEEGDAEKGDWEGKKGEEGAGCRMKELAFFF